MSTNPKSIYNEFIRANLPVGITYDEVRAQYVTGNGKRFPTYLQAKWYLDYIIKFGYSPVFSVASLFSDGEQGVWYDPSDLTTLFQDTAGTTPVTTAGQTVGLMLDKSQGLILGPELVTNGRFDTDTTGWTTSANASLSLSSNALRITASSNGIATASQAISGLTIGKQYSFTFDIVAETQSTGNPSYGSVGSNVPITSTGSFTVYFTADATTVTIRFGLGGAALAGEYIEIDNVSVKELPGYHATQATAAARPSYIVDADGTFIQHDLIDDALTVTLPDMGTEATVAYVTRSEVRLLEDQTISGSYTLPTQEIAGFVAIDRALTIVEKVKLIQYLASKVEGVNYGAEIDRLTLIAINAVDVFVYDTSKDSDGGAWRSGALAQASSWYNETLNTATRGSRSEFPAVAVIVAEAAKVTIYDGDDPSLPMWRVEDYTGLTVRAAVAINGQVWIGTSTGVVLSDYAGDDLGSTTLDYTTSTTPAIVNNSVNDIAATVLPDAPIDPATGLPVPTIAVATQGGVSVIKDDGTVVDSADFIGFTKITFSGASVAAWTSAARVLLVYDTYAADGFTFSRDYDENGTLDIFRNATPATLAHPSAIAPSAIALGMGGSDADAGLFTIAESWGHAHTTSTYNTGWMNCDIKGAFLSDTDDTDLVGGTDADRSVNGNDLTVNGTVTRTPVATGADLVAYSGFSASNYLERTDASYVDTLYALGWEQTSGVWEFKHGVVSTAPIDGLTITTNTLKIEGTKPKALIRLSATTPSASQLEKIESDEKVLFQENAQATLYGASDAVTALAHDPDTDLLHVGTSAGRSIFEGLRRVGNTTTSVSTSISASGGLIVEK